MCGRAAGITTSAIFLAASAVYVAVLRHQPLLASPAGPGHEEAPGFEGGEDQAGSFVRSAGWGTGGLAAAALAGVTGLAFISKSALADLHPAVAAAGGLFQAGIALLVLAAVGALLSRPSWISTGRGVPLSDAHGPFLLELQKPQFNYPLGGDVSLLDTIDGLALSLATSLFALAAHNLVVAGAFGEAPDHRDGLAAAAHGIHTVNVVCCAALALIAWRFFVAFVAVTIGSAALCFAGSYALAATASAYL